MSILLGSCILQGNNEPFNTYIQRGTSSTQLLLPQSNIQSYRASLHVYLHIRILNIIEVNFKSLNKKSINQQLTDNSIYSITYLSGISNKKPLPPANINLICIKLAFDYVIGKSIQLDIAYKYPQLRENTCHLNTE